MKLIFHSDDFHFLKHVDGRCDDHTEILLVRPLSNTVIIVCVTAKLVSGFQQGLKKSKIFKFECKALKSLKCGELLCSGSKIHLGLKLV